MIFIHNKSNNIYPENIYEGLLDLAPILSFCSYVSFVKKIPSNSLVSYRETFIAKKNMKIAIVAVEYGDRYPYSLSNKGDVLIRGQKASILGSICMDQGIARHEKE